MNEFRCSYIIKIINTFREQTIILKYFKYQNPSFHAQILSIYWWSISIMARAFTHMNKIYYGKLQLDA